MNQFLDQPTTNFQRVRDGRNSMPLYIDIDLSAARSIAAGTALKIDIAANSFYSDADTNNSGNATVHFQDTNLGATSAPFFVSPGFIAAVAFTQILIENAAQPGKRIRIFYGVDIDFQAGVNTSSTVINATQVRKTFTQNNQTVGVANGQIAAGKADRDYLLIQNTHATGTVYINLTGAAATIAGGIKLPPGSSLELSNTVPNASIQAISDTPATTIIYCEA